MNKIRKGDTVKILAGKDKGRTGTVLDVVKKKKKPKTGLWVLVEGINVVKKHVRGNPQMQKPGGIMSQERPIHYSNVALLDPTSDKATRVGFKTLDDGQKVRVAKVSGEVYDA